MNPASTKRVPIGRKLTIIQLLLLAVIAAISALAFATFERVGGAAERVAQRYSPQLDRISNMQLLMFRISLEARHAMLVTTDDERKATIDRIGGFRNEMLATMKAFEDAISTPEGRAKMQEIRAADAVFWRLGGEVLGKVQAGDVPGAFAQLNAELVPARNAMVDQIAEQRRWQQALVLNAVEQARQEANFTKLLVLAVAILGTSAAGWLSWNLARMMQGAFARAHQVTRRIAGGNLRDAIYVRKGDEFGHLFESIVDMQTRLHDVVAHVRRVATNVAVTAQSIEGVNGELVRATESHALAVDGTTASTQRMANTALQSADHIESANRLASSASQVAVQGGDVVSRVVQTMRGIDDSSKRISDIVGVIDGIAFQTNILALNAAVEAARAGEQGRGFAVVAAEVRNLAQRSASAAREVKTLISESVERVDSGSAMVSTAGETMQRIVASVDEVTRLMGDIAQAAREQRQDMAMVDKAVGEISSATQQSLDAVRRCSDAANALREHARELESAVAAFNLNVDDLR